MDREEIINTQEKAIKEHSINRDKMKRKKIKLANSKILMNSTVAAKTNMYLKPPITKES